ncbi:MAG: sulfurtransferase TusA family protein [Candidatus Omnitrophota bacterium]
MKKIELNGKIIEVASTIDALGLFCPMPIVKLKVGLEGVDRGAVVELLADDPGVLEDVPAWCKETNNKFLSIKENKEGIFVAYVEKQQEE